MLAFVMLLPLLALFGLVIPVARGADHQVTVGGIGILKYDPEFVVCMLSLDWSLPCRCTEFSFRTQLLEIPSLLCSNRRTIP